MQRTMLTPTDASDLNKLLAHLTYTPRQVQLSGNTVRVTTTVIARDARTATVAFSWPDPNSAGVTGTVAVLSNWMATQCVPQALAGDLTQVYRLVASAIADRVEVAAQSATATAMAAAA